MPKIGNDILRCKTLETFKDLLLARILTVVMLVGFPPFRHSLASFVSEKCASFYRKIITCRTKLFNNDVYEPVLHENYPSRLFVRKVILKFSIGLNFPQHNLLAGAG